MNYYTPKLIAWEPGIAKIAIRDKTYTYRCRHSADTIRQCLKRAPWRTLTTVLERLPDYKPSKPKKGVQLPLFGVWKP